VNNLWGDTRQPRLEVTVDERLVIDWTHEVIVFRIIELALQNTWRHADARTVHLSITAPDDALTVEIGDDGAGFEPGTATSGTGTGIPAMHTLAAFVDGEVQLDSAPGRGTRVQAVLAGAAPRPRLRLVTDTG
jgi:signal transduction histidine kinase